MRYLVPNITDSEFASLLIAKIKHRDSFSFTRFGDGEIMILNNEITDSVKSMMLSWNNGKLEDSIKIYQSILKKALSDSDIIGLMNPTNDIAKKISYNPSKWSIKESTLLQVRSKPIIIADHMLVRNSQFGDPYNFKKIIGGEPICIISPRAKELAKNKISEILSTRIRFVNVPMNINEFDRSFIFKELDSIKEQLVLFGSSARGKDFGSYLANRGKIALDYGATLDAWAGIVSRPWFNAGNLQNHCLIK